MAAEFAGGGVRAPVGHPAEQQAQPDAPAGVQIQHVVVLRRGAAPVLGQHRQPHVVLDEHRDRQA